MTPLVRCSVRVFQVMSLNLPMVGAVNYAKGDYLKEYGISEMLSTFEVLIIFSRYSQLILLVIMMVSKARKLIEIFTQGQSLQMTTT